MTAIRVDYQEPTLAPKARKMYSGLTGKAWRKYCRDYRRARQVWKKQGCPTRTMSMYIPYADIIQTGPNTFTAFARAVDNFSESMQGLGEAVKETGDKFAEAMKAHPSNYQTSMGFHVDEVDWELWEMLGKADGE